MQGPRSTLARGAIAGAIGAATLAVVFLIIDVARGAPFATPAFLAGLVAGRGGPVDSPALIALYTAIHFALFIVAGIAVAALLEKARITPHFLLGAMIGFLLFDIVFYTGVAIIGVNVVNALGWPAVLAGNVIAGIAMFAYLQMTAPAGTPAWREAFRGTITREGIIAGLAGATAVAVWFLVVDVLQDRIFFTPAALGSALFLQAGSTAEVSMSAGMVVGYTVVHVLSFVAVGMLGAWLFGHAETEPPILLGTILLFVTLEVFFIGLIAIVASWLLDVIPWWMIVIANLVAGVVMGIYLWRAHPALRREIARESLEEPSHMNRSAVA